MTTFLWTYDANAVSIVGSFNNWTPTPLSSGSKGEFSITLDLAPGIHEYKFIVDGRRWCYDVLKPTSTDDRGNRNNTITVGGAQGKKAQHQKQEHKHEEHKHEEHKHEEHKHEEPKEEHEEQHEQHEEQKEEHEEEHAKEEVKPQGKGKGKGQGQQQQGKGKGQQPKKEQQQQKKGGPSPVARAQAQQLIKTIKSYNAPVYVGDVDCSDSLEDVLETAKLVQAGIPDVAVMLVSSGIVSFIVAAVVPNEKVEILKATDFVNTALSIVHGAQAEGTDTFAHGVVAADPEKAIFPLKLKDQCRGPTFVLLRKLGLVAKDEESDDEMFFLDE